MMKKTKRTLTTIIVFFLLLCSYCHFPGNAEKATPFMTAEALTYVGICGENAKWELDTKLGRLTITGKGKTADCTPDEPALWDKYSDVIKTVEIEKGITEIGEYSFYRMKALESVTLPKTLKKIGKCAFMGCERLRTVENYMTSALDTIGERAFAYCRRMYKMPVSSRVKTVEKEAFLYCYGLKSMTLGNSVTALGENALSCCCNMKYVEIVNSSCEIFDSPDTIYRDITVRSFKKSTAYDYADSFIRKFKIIKNIVSLDAMTPTVKTAKFVYDGTRKKPKVTLKNLVSGRDYTVDYVDNIEPGIATAIVSAAGSTVGQTKTTFRILPPAPENLRVTGRASGSMTLSWDVSHGATKYQIFMRSGTEWKQVAETKKTTVTVKGLENGKIYVFRMRAVTETKKGICRSEYTKASRFATKPNTPGIEKISLVRGGGKLRITLNGVRNAEGYELYMADGEGKSFIKIADLSPGSLKYTAEGLSNRNNYYFKARAYISMGKSKVYSAFSDIQKSNVL